MADGNHGPAKERRAEEDVVNKAGEVAEESGDSGIEDQDDRIVVVLWVLFFFQAEDGIRDLTVTGVQTCALPISAAAGVDYLGLSFVRRAGDLGGLRALVPPDVKLVAKIEKATALEDLGRILEACVAGMGARGDPGGELPVEGGAAGPEGPNRGANRHR